MRCVMDIHIDISSCNHIHRVNTSPRNPNTAGTKTIPIPTVVAMGWEYGVGPLEIGNINNELFFHHMVTNIVSYEGSFADDEIHGTGVLQKFSGGKYRGKFWKGQRHGEGVEVQLS